MVGDQLITAKAALEILTFVSASGLYAGSRRTNELTKYPCGKSILYSRAECEALRDSIFAAGNQNKIRRERISRRANRRRITELV